MSKNPFTSNNYDLGGSDTYGLDIQSATDALLYQPTNQYMCYVCNNPAHYQVVAKEDKHNTAQLQNGLYVCKACLPKTSLSPKLYAMKNLL